MTPPTTDQTKSVHMEYQRLTGHEIPWSMYRHYCWERWIASGFVRNDLASVVDYIRKRIREKKRQPEALLFRNLIQNPDNFAEDLSMARALSRVPVRTNRDRTLELIGRKLEPVREVKRSGSVMDGIEALKKFQEWRKENGL